MWHCPHCGTPQAETARCWVCRRSSTTCSTCRHFRRAVTPGIGFCGLDATRRPLRGVEVRGCWQAVAVPSEPAGATPPGRPVEPSRHRGFVPLEAVAASGAATSPEAPAPSVLPPPPPAAAERGMLFDLDA